MVQNYPLVTIGIPTYNRADKTLTEAIESACRQDYPNLEIIVSDNCSTDATEQLVFSFNDERVNYLRQKTNIGPNNNYNACLKAAKGAYFLLLHDDDLIDNDFVSVCMAKAEYSTDYGFIRTGTRIIGPSNQHLKDRPNLVYSSSPDEMFLAWVESKISFHLCSILYNTAALQEIGGFKSKNNLFEDGFTIIKISEKHPILNIVDIKASFRKHPQQRTQKDDVMKWTEDFRLALDMIYLQDPDERKEIYIKGMKKFASVTINQFARQVKNPIRRMTALIGIGRFFPHYYWPESGSIKIILSKNISRLIFYNRTCLVRK